VSRPIQDQRSNYIIIAPKTRQPSKQQKTSARSANSKKDVMTYDLSKGTTKAGFNSISDESVDYLTEYKNGIEVEKVALNAGRNFDKTEVKKIFGSPMFQRAIMSNDVAVIRALSALLPKEMQTAETVINIMRARKETYGLTEKDNFLEDMVGNNDGWASFAAFRKVHRAAHTSSEFGVTLENEKGCISPTTQLSRRPHGKQTPEDFEKAVSGIIGALKYVAEQERLEKEKTLTRTSKI